MQKVLSSVVVDLSPTFVFQQVPTTFTHQVPLPVELLKAIICYLQDW